MAGRKAGDGVASKVFFRINQSWPLQLLRHDVIEEEDGFIPV